MARKATVKKKTTSAPRGSKASRLIEEKHIGYETVDWASVPKESLNDKMRETLRHYGYFYDVKDRFSWATQWVKDNRTKQELKHFKASQDRMFSMTVCGLCRMQFNGVQLNEKMLNMINQAVDEAIESGKKALKEKSQNSNNDTGRKSPADIVKERTSDFIANVEEVLDMFDTKTWVDWEEYSVYNELQKNELPYNTAKAVVDYYTPLRDELKELVEKKTEDLVESYSHLGVRKRKKLLNVVQGIIDDAEKYMISKKAVRKPRKKKATSVTQQVSKFKYLPESAEYKTKSVNPVNIIGAKEAYLFNTKYRHVTHLVSSSKSGFEIKGTTIQNVDIEGSTRKTVRKPEEFLTDFNKATKVRKRKLVSELKTKPAAVNGRTNEQTIILKVY